MYNVPIKATELDVEDLRSHPLWEVAWLALGGEQVIVTVFTTPSTEIKSYGQVQTYQREFRNSWYIWANRVPFWRVEASEEWVMNWALGNKWITSEIWTPIHDNKLLCLCNAHLKLNLK